MSLWFILLCVGEVLFVLGFFAALVWSDRRTAVRPQESRLRGLLRAGAALRWHDRHARPQEPFPVPRDTDCAYGCCKAGDEGLWSELVTPEQRGRAQAGTEELIGPHSFEPGGWPYCTRCGCARSVAVLGDAHCVL